MDTMQGIRISGEGTTRRLDRAAFDGVELE